MSTHPHIFNPSPRTITLVRHGETQGNLDDKAQGHFDAPLTELGRSQAQALGERLAETEFDAIYSSDLQRAVDTALAIIDLQPDHEIQTRAGLREVYFGSYEDMRWSEIREHDPELHQRWTSWNTRIDTHFILTATKDSFLVTAHAEAHDGDERIWSRSWENTIPRDGV